VALKRARAQLKFDNPSVVNPTSPLRWTADPKARPLDWAATLAEHYDAEDTAKGNLKRLEAVGGDRVRSEINRLRQLNPALTDEEILGELFRVWDRPKKM
jgi:hypothetical protein